MKESVEKYLSGIVILLMAVTISACGGETQEKQQEMQTATVDTTAASESMTQAVPEAKLNINTASAESFQTIPGVGDRMVGEFEEYRPYVSIQQFRKEIGKYVDEEQVASYEKYIFVPINANESDASTMQQIPGLDGSEAEELINGRPYNSNDAFIEALSQYVSEDELEVAKSYMES